MGDLKILKEKEVSVILWIKALYDFENPDCPHDTLDDKLKKFDFTTAKLYKEDYEAGIAALIDIGALTIDDESNVAKLTTKGNILMVSLSAIKGFSDETVTNIMNGTIIVTDFVVEHRKEIASILLKVFEKVVFA